jgi:predicted ATPase
MPTDVTSMSLCATLRLAYIGKNKATSAVISTRAATIIISNFCHDNNNKKMGETSMTNEWSADSKLLSPSITSALTSDAISEFSRPPVMTALAQKPGNGAIGFTLDKLKYATLGLYGREKELESMHNTLEKLMASALPEHERQLIVISGFSGTGKTSLANHGLKQSTEKLGGLYVRGKFDMNIRNQPYSGIDAACSEIWNAISELQCRHASSFQLLCNQIKTELGSELGLLVQVIPSLAKVVDCAEDDADNDKDDPNEKSGRMNMVEMSLAESRNQFNFAFLRFIRTISYQFLPLVFVLDNLQWADGASLALIDVLLTDSSTSRLMVVGIYRTNEVDKTHISYRTIEDLQQKTRDKCFEMTQLEIGNLEPDAVHSIILELLASGNDSQTRSLAEICHKKTLGNPFSVLQYLANLIECRMLRFNFGTVSWTWDEKEIEVSTSACDNVVDLLKARMEELSTNFIDVLKLASCLGSTFEVDTLKLIRDKTSMRSSRQDHDHALMASLEAFEAAGYILKSAATTAHLSYRWVNDITQEAALSLIPETERGTIAARIGVIILKHCKNKGLGSKIFLVLNLLNQADDKLLDYNKRLDLARLNYRASQKAVSLSAFESAADYATRGIRLLSKNAWVDHYEFTLLIYTTGAQAEGFIGNVDTMQHYCQQVLLQEERPIEDKLGVYNTLIDSAVNQGLLDDARDLLITVLKKFHCPFPKNSALVGLELVSNIVHIKASAKTLDASKLSLLNDRTKLEVMKLVDKLNLVLNRLQDDRMPLTVFRSVNWTIRYGVCDLSSVAFARAGLIFTGLLSDLQGGTKFGQQALALIETSKSQSSKGRTLFLVHSFVFPWTKPARSLLKPLQRSYDVGLQTG